MKRKMQAEALDAIDCPPTSSQVFVEFARVSTALRYVWLNDWVSLKSHYDIYPESFQQRGEIDVMAKCEIRPATPLQLAVCILNSRLVVGLRHLLPDHMFDQQVKGWFRQCSSNPYYDIACTRRPSHLDGICGELSECIEAEHDEVSKILRKLIVMPQYLSCDTAKSEQNNVNCQFVTFDNIRRSGTSSNLLSLSHTDEIGKVEIDEIVFFMSGP